MEENELPEPFDMDVSVFLHGGKGKSAKPTKGTKNTKTPSAKKKPSNTKKTKPPPKRPPKTCCCGICVEIQEDEPQGSSSGGCAKCCDELGKGANACAVM